MFTGTEGRGERLWRGLLSGLHARVGRLGAKDRPMRDGGQC